ncbi:MAG: AraC family transcriptional regulator [Bacteroidales bacterium]|jgi:AraC-like DNA-binding protein|nr:AraC family transcriptional regulator [Bacteroidales bacterium]
MFLEEADKIIQFISAFLLILFSMIILLQKRGKRMPRFFLSAFFISRALIIIFFASYFYPGLIYRYPDLYVMGVPVLFLYAPFLFLYTRSVTTDKQGIRWYDGFHFLPFILVLGYFLIYFHFYPGSTKTSILLGDELFNPFLVDGTLLWIQFFVYAIAITYLLVEYRIKLKLYNSTYSHDMYHWLVFLVGAFLLWKAIFVSGYLFGVLKEDYASVFRIFIELAFLFYASMIVYKGLKIPHVVLSLEEDPYKSSALTADDRQVMLSRLRTVMINEKSYLDPQLTLTRLARLCDIPSHHLSQILNIDLKQNFYTYTNNHRIEEAKMLLSDPEKKDHTILEILYEVGFNSKSVFNTAFKKNTGMTPTDYRKKMQAQDAA